MCLESIMKLPTEPAVSGDGESIERHVLEERRECGLKGNPERIIRTDRHTNDGNIESRSSAIVDKEAIGIVEAPCYKSKRW